MIESMPKWEAETALYRHFDKDGALLYVGITISTVSRLKQHRENAHWWGDIRSVSIEVFPDRWAALEAEEAAIKSEFPKHNYIHNAKVRRVPPKPVPVVPDVTAETEKPRPYYTTLPADPDDRWILGREARAISGDQNIDHLAQVIIWGGRSAVKGAPYQRGQTLYLLSQALRVREERERAKWAAKERKRLRQSLAA